MALGGVVLAGGLAALVIDATVFAPVVLPTPTSLPPTALSTSPSAEASPAAPSNTPDPSVRIFRIDPAQSEVRYEVGETFFDQNRFAVAVGRTQGISGDITVNLDRPASSQLSEIVIDVSQFTSDETRRDNFIRRNGLQSALFPLARFAPTAIEGFPEDLATGQEASFTVHGDLTVREVTRPVSWQVTARQDGDRILGSAETQILMSDFGVGPIRISFLATEDTVRLVFDFVAIAEEQ